MKISEVSDSLEHVMAELKHLESKIQMTHDKLSNEIKIVYWVIGIAMAVMAFIVARK